MSKILKARDDLKPNFIRQWRKIKGLTMDELVQKARENGLDTTQPTISRIERGVHPWSQPIIECISTVLKVEPWELLQDPISKSHANLFEWLRRLSEAEISHAENVLRAVFPGMEVSQPERPYEADEDPVNVVKVDFSKPESSSLSKRPSIVKSEIRKKD